MIILHLYKKSHSETHHAKIPIKSVLTLITYIKHLKFE